MSAQVFVVAEMKAKPGREAGLREGALALVTPTLQEEGCLQYDLHVSDSDPGKLLFYEIWTSREALDAHLKTPHFSAFMVRAEELLNEPATVTTYSKIA